MTDLGKAVALGVLVLALAALGIAWEVSNYRECRRHGFSALYCTRDK